MNKIDIMVIIDRVLVFIYLKLYEYIIDLDWGFPCAKQQLGRDWSRQGKTRFSIWI